MHRLMLSNGYRVDPVGLDWRFESICELCTYFQITGKLRPTLGQSDDYAEKSQVGFQKIFYGPPASLDAQAS